MQEDHLRKVLRKSFLLCCRGQFNGLAQLGEVTAQQKASRRDTESDLRAKFAHSHISLLAKLKTDPLGLPMADVMPDRGKVIMDVPPLRPRLTKMTVFGKGSVFIYICLQDQTIWCV